MDPANYLPDEMMIKIFYSLSPSDLARCKMANRNWHRLAGDKTLVYSIHSLKTLNPTIINKRWNFCGEIEVNRPCAMEFYFEYQPVPFELMSYQTKTTETTIDTKQPFYRTHPFYHNRTPSMTVDATNRTAVKVVHSIDVKSFKPASYLGTTYAHRLVAKIIGIPTTTYYDGGSIHATYFPPFPSV